MNGQKLEKETFGWTAAGETVDRYTLRNAGGMIVRTITYGATVTELFAPDRHGTPADVVLGFDDLASYESHNAYFGCMVGRVAFRIRDGRFSLDGKQYQLACDAGGAHLHGGPLGFSKIVWQAEPLRTPDGPAVKLTCRSPDGDQGYPGTLDVSVVYSLTDDNEFRVDCTATTDQSTLVNLAHHSYFNLCGAGCRDILDHRLRLDADLFIPAGAPGVPSGDIVTVRETPFDFTQSTRIGARIEETGGDPPGYDFCYLRNAPAGATARVAELCEPASGRRMEISTNEPAIVAYTANYLDGTLRGKGGAVYERHAAICLETGRPPDAIRFPHLPSIVLHPGDPYRHMCIYRFATA
jgi:aldose 1-epimerase